MLTNPDEFEFKCVEPLVLIILVLLTSNKPVSSIGIKNVQVALLLTFNSAVLMTSITPKNRCKRFLLKIDWICKFQLQFPQICTFDGGFMLIIIKK